MRRTDEEITGDIIAALAANPNVYVNEMTISTRNGMVHLTGPARTLEERDEAERIASGIEGVVAVENDLVLSPNREISDREMTQAVNDELAAYPDLVAIGAKVTAGTATLMGTVASLSIENRAIDVASGIDGIRQVVSALHIAAGEPVDDITLANDVAEAISDEPGIDIIELDVRADDGLVVITGDVETEREFDRITELASAVPGIQRVQNLVRVYRNAIPNQGIRRPSSSGTQFQPRPIGKEQ